MISRKSPRNNTKPKIIVTPYLDRVNQEIQTEKGIVKKRINIWERRSPETKENSSEVKTPKNYYTNRNVEKEQKYLEAPVGTYSECFSFLQDQDRKYPPSSSRLSILWSKRNKSCRRKIIGKGDHDETKISMDNDSSLDGISVLNYTTEGSMNDPFWPYDEIFMKKSYDDETYIRGNINIGKFHEETSTGSKIDNSKVCQETSLSGESTITNNISRNSDNLGEYSSLITSNSTINSFCVETNNGSNEGNIQKNAIKGQTKSSSNFMVIRRKIMRHIKDILLLIFIVKFAASIVFSRNEAC